MDEASSVRLVTQDELLRVHYAKSMRWRGGLLRVVTQSVFRVVLNHSPSDKPPADQGAESGVASAPTDSSFPGVIFPPL